MGVRYHVNFFENVWDGSDESIVPPWYGDLKFRDSLFLKTKNNTGKTLHFKFRLTRRGVMIVKNNVARIARNPGLGDVTPSG